MLKRLLKKKLTVRDTEALIKAYHANINGDQAVMTKVLPHQQSSFWKKQFESIFSSPVSVKINDKGEGKMMIHFSSVDEIEWLISRLTPMIPPKDKKI
jgi:ParB family chromosome partitioning protein